IGEPPHINKEEISQTLCATACFVRLLAIELTRANDASSRHHHDNTGTELGSLHGRGEPHVEAKRLNKQAWLIRDFLTRSESELIPIPLKPRTVAWKH